METTIEMNTTATIEQDKAMLVELINEHKATKTFAPQLYVTSWKRYNEGSLEGMWIDLETFSGTEELVDFCEAYLGEGSEIMFSDCDNIPENLYSEDYDEELLDTLFEFIELDKDEQDIVEAYWEYVDDGKHDLGDIIHSLAYHGDPTDFYDDLAEREFEEERNFSIWDYFDYDKWYEECRHNYYEAGEYVFNVYC